jgi:hypothetical protein
MQHEHNVNLPPEATDAVKEVSETAKDVKRGLRRIKQHLQDNKNRYLIGGGVIGGTVIVGGGGILIGMRLAPQCIADVTQAATNAIGDVSDSSTVTVDQSVKIIQVAARGSRGHIIIDGAGNIVGRSFREAAKNEGVPYTAVREVCKGLRDVAPNGKTYTDLGENLTEQVRIGLA